MPPQNAQLTSIIRQLQAHLATPDTAFLAQSAATWTVIDRKFSGPLGPLGVKAILARCINQMRPQYPWLPASRGIDFAELHKCYAQQDVQAAVLANSELLESFITLLAALIGASLTATFLRSAFGDGSAAPISLEN